MKAPQAAPSASNALWNRLLTRAETPTTSLSRSTCVRASFESMLLHANLTMTCSFTLPLATPSAPRRRRARATAATSKTKRARTEVNPISLAERLSNDRVAHSHLEPAAREKLPVSSALPPPFEMSRIDNAHADDYLFIPPRPKPKQPPETPPSSSNRRDYGSQTPSHHSISDDEYDADRAIAQSPDASPVRAIAPSLPPYRASLLKQSPRASRTAKVVEVDQHSPIVLSPLVRPIKRRRRAIPRAVVVSSDDDVSQAPQKPSVPLRLPLSRRACEQHVNEAAISPRFRVQPSRMLRNSPIRCDSDSPMERVRRKRRRPSRYSHSPSEPSLKKVHVGKQREKGGDEYAEFLAWKRLMKAISPPMAPKDRGMFGNERGKAGKDEHDYAAWQRYKLSIKESPLDPRDSKSRMGNDRFALRGSARDSSFSLYNGSAKQHVKAGDGKHKDEDAVWKRRKRGLPNTVSKSGSKSPRHLRTDVSSKKGRIGRRKGTIPITPAKNCKLIDLDSEDVSDLRRTGDTNGGGSDGLEKRGRGGRKGEVVVKKEVKTEDKVFPCPNSFFEAFGSAARRPGESPQKKKVSADSPASQVFDNIFAVTNQSLFEYGKEGKEKNGGKGRREDIAKPDAFSCNIL